MAKPTDISARIAALDWAQIGQELDVYGCAVAKAVLTPEECRGIAARFGEDASFRRQVDMAAQGYGRGHYKYWAYPLPEEIAAVRTALYSPLAHLANRWNERMKLGAVFPSTHEAYLQSCHAAGQTKPTPLLLHYREGDFNGLHQDVYGDLVFPLQVAFLLSEPGVDFTGGEFVLTEDFPDGASRAEVVNLQQGDGVIFAVRHRPGGRDGETVNLRHGVSRIRSGQRHTLGIIFHDAK